MENPDERSPGTPQPAEHRTHLEAHASDQAGIHQAGRDLHLYERDNIPGARPVEPDGPRRECPYPGLAAFGRQQARWFFGREQLTSELITRLDGRLRTGGIQLVVAPSGAGKSSLLHAGLLTQLGNGALPGSARWPTMVFTPTAQPLPALATQIATVTGADPVALAGQLVADSQRAGSAPRGRIRGGDPDTRLVMVVDQFEELFTLCNDDRQRRTFIEVLTQLAAPQSAADSDRHPVGLVVVGVRADFCTACLNYAPLSSALQDRALMVGSMSDAELRAAILYPAQNTGLRIEPGLVDLLLRDLGNSAPAADNGESASYAAGRLPLLAHALQATWQQDNGQALTIAGYRKTGGIQHAVATTAERVFAELKADSQAVARTLFLRLIRIGDGTEDTRRRIPRTDLLRGLDPGSALPVLDAFTQHRLLTQDRDTVEITHEALLRAWPRLRQWIDTDRAGNLTRQELEEAATVWDREGRDNARLYRGQRLEAAHAWDAFRSNQDDLNPAMAAFLAASTHQEHRAVRLRRTVLIVLSVLALVASGVTAAALQQSASAEEQRDTAIFNRVVAEADQLRSKDASLAAQLDLTAYQMRPGDRDLYTKLLTAQNATLSTPLTDHTGPVRSVSFSPDGKILASAGDDRTVRLWNYADPAHPTDLGQPLLGHTDAVLSVAFSTDGKILTSAGRDDTVRLWNLTDPNHPTPLGQPLTGHTADILSVAFSTDRRILASASANQTVLLWDLTDDPTRPEPSGEPLTGQNRPVTSVAFSPDTRRLASIGSDNDDTVLLWDLTDPTRPVSLDQPPTDDICACPASSSSVAFSPDGRILASTTPDGAVWLWNISDPAAPSPLFPIPGSYIHSLSVAFSPDGRTLATASHETSVRLWDVTDPADPRPLGQSLTGHTNSVWSVAFSPDGRSVATASTDHTIRSWHVPETILNNRKSYSSSSLAFSPNGQTLASADGTVRLWNVADPTHPTPLDLPLPSHTSRVRAVAFSPDGRLLASASDDQTVRLSDLADPTDTTVLGEPLADHTNTIDSSALTADTINSVAFSPNGRILAIPNRDYTVKLWDITDLRRPLLLDQPLTGHTKGIYSVAFSPNGRILASGSRDGTVWLWDVTDPNRPKPLEKRLGHKSSVSSVAFSRDGRILASASADQTIKLWDLSDPIDPKRLGETLTGHTSFVSSVAFSPDGRTLASGSNDLTVRLWDLTDPTHPPLGQPLTGHPDGIYSVAFSPDGSTLASAGYSATVRLWRMNDKPDIEPICDYTGNTLTPEKWRQYISEALSYTPPCPE